MALDQRQQMALEFLKHKDISIKEAHELIDEFIRTLPDYAYVKGYKTTHKDDADTIVFKSNTDGWCFEYSKAEVARLQAASGIEDMLRQDLLRKHKLALSK